MRQEESVEGTPAEQPAIPNYELMLRRACRQSAECHNPIVEIHLRSQSLELLPDFRVGNSNLATTHGLAPGEQLYSPQDNRRLVCGNPRTIKSDVKIILGQSTDPLYSMA